MPRQATAGFGSRQSALLVLCRDRNSMSRHGSQILSHRNCRNMAFLIATGVLFSVVTMSRQRFPCRDQDGHDERSGSQQELD